MRLTMSVINQDGATNELSSGNWTECGYWLPEWFGASVSFVGDDFFCFSCMGLSKDFLHVAIERPILTGFLKDNHLKNQCLVVGISRSSRHLTQSSIIAY